MPAEVVATCDSCRISWPMVDLTYRVGPIDYKAFNYEKLWCPQCLIVLHHVSQIDRSAWERWYRFNASELAKSKFATSICDRISEIVSTQNWYVPIDIRLSELHCPRHPQLLEVGDWDMGKVFCPECRQRTGQLAETPSLAIVDYPDGIP